METFGDRLQGLRKRGNLTLEALAAEIGSTKSYLWDLENKPTIRPSAALVHRLAVALDNTVGVLLGEASPRRRCREGPGVLPQLPETHSRDEATHLADHERVGEGRRGRRTVKSSKAARSRVCRYGSGRRVFWTQASVLRRSRRPWNDTARRRSSTPTRAASSPASPSPGPAGTRRPDLDGRQGPVHGQYRHRAAVAFAQMRGNRSAPEHRRLQGPAFDR